MEKQIIKKGGDRMFAVHGDTIFITRGDTGCLDVNLSTQDGDYVMRADDTLTLTVRKRVDADILFQKKVTGMNRIIIEPADTQKAAYGRYVYDIEFRTADGYVSTVITPAVFQIGEEVTY